MIVHITLCVLAGAAAGSFILSAIDTTILQTGSSARGQMALLALISAAVFGGALGGLR